MAEWFDWTKLSSDPNLPDSRRRMTDFLLSVRREHPNQGAMPFLEAIAAGRRVLDVGVVSPGAHGAGDEKWRHGRIAAAASYCLGVDILAPEVEELRRRGFNVVVADATSDRDLGERFDVVLLGDVIEHVSRPVDLLAFAKRHLAPDARVFASTPNPFSHKFFHGFRQDGVAMVNLDHVGWITPTAAVEIGRRADLKLEAYHLLKRDPQRLHRLWAWAGAWMPVDYRYPAYVYEYRAIE